MTLTSDTETRQTTMTVTVRVPNGADGDLTTDAQRRLSRAYVVFAVTVEELRDLQPGLSATEVTVCATVEVDRSQDSPAVADALTSLTGIKTLALSD
jgi:hypothetical protein